MRSTSTPAHAVEASSRWSARSLALLALVVLVAATQRLLSLDRLPPGINQDEALSAWNAWCLLHTGTAMTGEVWPVFSCRNIGDYPTMLYFYVLIPFQALGGMNPLTTRLPVALAGVLTVPLLAWVGARLFRPSVGLIAAGMFAVAPWAVIVGRFGFGAGLTPLQALLPLAALLLAGFPIARRPSDRIRPGWALVAGLTAGLAGYGFHSLRLYAPLLLAGLALVSPGGMKALMCDARGRLALLLLAAGFAITFGPLAWQSLVDPAMMKRWEMTRLWIPTDPWLSRVALVAGRWLGNFGPGFLFVHGSTFPIFRPMQQGELGWYVLPGLVAGAAVVLMRIRRDLSVRTLAVLVALYPVGDLVSRYDGPNPLRSALGIPSLLLLAAFGLEAAYRGLQSRSAPAARSFAVALTLAAVGQESLHTMRFFTQYALQPQVRVDQQVDLLEAARWLRPHLSKVDAVFCSGRGRNMPFSIVLMGLEYDPGRWFTVPRVVEELEFDRYLRVGRTRYVFFGPQAQHDLDSLASDGISHQVLFIARPHEFGLDHPERVIHTPDGREELWICRRRYGPA